LGYDNINKRIYNLTKCIKQHLLLDSERNEECIDFTMMCVFVFVSVYSITSRYNTLISNFGVVSDVKRSKVNIFQQFSKKKSRKTK
ncbi:Uncharacterized protein FWK35_00034094, partial [Aphis craccivora]